MNIPETTRSLWLLLFGKRIDKTLEQGNQLIEYWRNIYRGEPCWKYYTTQGDKRTQDSNAVSTERG